MVPNDKKGKKARVVLVKTEVRRSPRLKLNNKGFKADHNSKKCLGCNPNPPDLTPTMIKKLGTSFCQIDEDVLTEKVLKPKKKKSSKKSKTVEVKQLKENKQPKGNEEAPTFQDEEGEDSSTPKDPAPKKNPKK